MKTEMINRKYFVILFILFLFSMIFLFEINDFFEIKNDDVFKYFKLFNKLSVKKFSEKHYTLFSSIEANRIELCCNESL